MEVKTSSFQIPRGESVSVTFIRLDNGKVVPRHPDEVVPRPTPPAGRA
jgi:hypothetical protein